MPQTQGSIRPITIPLLSEPANIRDALTQLYYGDPANSGTDPSNTNTDTLYASQNSIAAYIQQLFQDKANLENPVFRKYVDGTTKAGQIGIQNAAGTKSTKITVGALTADLTLTLPLITANDILVSENFTQTLTNKTLTAPTINGGTATALTGFSLRDTSAAYNVTVTATSSTVLTAARTLTVDLDNANRTLKLAKGLTIQTGDVTLTGNASGSSVTLPTTGTLATLAGTEILTNKTLTAPVIATIVNNGTLTLPVSTDTLVGRATTDILTNKTLTAPVIATIVNTGTLTLPTSTDTLVGRATTDTLTNKSISGATNNFSNIPNSATTATNANTASAIVARDGSGNFSAGTITANLTGNVNGNVSGNLTGNVLGATSTIANLSGGLSGQVPYQSAANTTAFTGSGSTGNILQLKDGVPTWTDPTIAGSVNNAKYAYNLSGTTVNSIPYQVAPTIPAPPGVPDTSATSYIAVNTSATKQFLSQVSSGVPVWSAVSKADVGLGNVENVSLATWAGNTSITSVGTLVNLTVTNTINGSITGNAATVTNGVTSAATLASGAILKGAGSKTVAAATASDIVTAIGTTAVTNATNATNAVSSDKAVAVVHYGGASGTMNYSTPTNKIYTGATPPSTGMSVGDIWMW